MPPTLFRRLRPAAAALAALGFLAAPAPANAATALRASLIETKKIKLDGVLKEWDGLVDLTKAVKGKPQKSDLSAQGAVSYDNTNVYVAVEVKDDTFKAGLDHIALVLGFPGGHRYEVELYPGQPGKTAGSAKMGGKAIKGAKVVEAPRSGGYSLEASIPWSTFAAASSVRIGLRGGLFVHDADGGAVDAIIGTAGSTAYASLPQVATESEQALADGLIKQKRLKGAPKYNLLGDVAGSSMKERVLVYERYLIVLGSHFRNGSEYYYSDMGVDANAGMVPACELKDVNGDGQQEIILRKRFGTSTKYREVLQVLSFGKSDVPNVLLSHEVAIVTPEGRVENTVSTMADGSKIAFKFEPGTAKSFHAGNFKEPTEAQFEPALLPWSTIKSQTYKISGSAFTKASEEKQSATAAPATAKASVAAPPKPPAPSAAELLNQVYALYKKDRSATGTAKFDMAINVAGDRQVERVLLHGKDLVVFGKGFKGGTGYSYLGLQQFASASDITDVTARDVTGDGKAEIIVRGLIHAKAPKEAGGGTVDREVALVFQLQGDAIKRIFAAEVGRSIGSNKVAGVISYGTKTIELGPGHFKGWTERTYPFNQDISAVGGYEPLIIPWSGAKSVKYKWNGSSFTK